MNECIKIHLGGGGGGGGGGFGRGMVMFNSRLRHKLHCGFKISRSFFLKIGIHHVSGDKKLAHLMFVN